MEKKALFFDIDGTLLSEVTGKVPPSAIDALHQAAERGHLLFINTGRTISSIPAEVKRLPVSGYACGCGTYITHEDKIIMERHMPHKRGREIIDAARKFNAELILEGTEDCYFPGHTSRFAEAERARRYFNAEGLGLEIPLEQDRFEYDKFVAYLDDQTDREAFLAELDKDMELIPRREGFYEVVPKGYSKATAIEYVLEYFGMRLEDAYVFGDSSNDLSMFQYAPHTVALGKHDASLEPYTEYVTTTVEEDGIRNAMKHYGLIE